MEQLSVLEYCSFLAVRPLLRFLASGDGHSVLIMPGFGATDQSTEQLRALLRRNGHMVHGWRLGRNVGPHPLIIDGTSRRMLELHERSGTTVSLVGWSLGGIYARELARDHPEAVRQVITLASPFRFRPGDRGHASSIYDAIGPREDPFPGHALSEYERAPLEVPATAIYTRGDGIVRWHACIDGAGPHNENIEVFGTHTGLGYNIAAAIAVADRLAQPEGEWAPFKPPHVIRHLYPKPATWVPAGQPGRWRLEP